jgi:putative membrane protein
VRREHLDRAAERYSLLFTLPSYKGTVTLLFIQCIATGIMVQLLFDLSSHGMLMGLALGGSLFMETFTMNYITGNSLLKKDLILDMRRCSFLSFGSNLILAASAFFAALGYIAFGDSAIWFKVAAIGVFASMSLRFLVFQSVSFVGSLSGFFAATLQPALFLVVLLFSPVSPVTFELCHIEYQLMAGLVAFISVQLFAALLNTLGTKAVGISSINLFKAFLVNWTEDIQQPLEEILERLSKEREITVYILAFKSKEKLKAAIVVPIVHPGPFKNVGSSAISSMIQTALEKKLGCVISVPHGISGHELDLASQTQNQKLISRLLEASEFDVFQAKATPYIISKKGKATAGCQIFGDCALVTLTLAPETMEDLPLELNDVIDQEAKKNGLQWAVAIDAHNSIEGPFNHEKAIAPVRKAAAAILTEASNSKQSRFEVGAAKITSTGFSIEEGMGPGGIVVIVTRVQGQTSAYVVIDGNNMVPGFREEILASLDELGIDKGEVMTTDTHVVNGVVVAGRGYHPIGEEMDRERLITYIKKAASQALENLEPAEAAWRRGTIRGVKAIGEQQIDGLSSLVDKGAKRAKRNSIIIFPAMGIILTVLLAML